jgi:flagellar basal-body rod modification protein FlgD
MTTNPVTAPNASDALAATTKKDPLGRDAFMNLLITQLQHQDPTQPQADGEFLAQLAQFSSLEQLQTMNQKLDTIAAFFADAQAAGATTKGAA